MDLSPMDPLAGFPGKIGHVAGEKVSKSYVIDSGLVGSTDFHSSHSQGHALWEGYHKAEDAQGTPTQSRVSPSILVYREGKKYTKWNRLVYEEQSFRWTAAWKNRWLQNGLHFSIQEQLLYGNVQRFRGGIVFEVHRIFIHPTLVLRVIKKTRSSGLPARVFDLKSTG